MRLPLAAQSYVMGDLQIDLPELNKFEASDFITIVKNNKAVFTGLFSQNHIIELSKLLAEKVPIKEIINVLEIWRNDYDPSETLLIQDNYKLALILASATNLPAPIASTNNNESYSGLLKFGM